MRNIGSIVISYNIVGKPIVNILLQKKEGANATGPFVIPGRMMLGSMRSKRTSSSLRPDGLEL